MKFRFIILFILIANVSFEQNDSINLKEVTSKTHKFYDAILQKDTFALSRILAEDVVYRKSDGLKFDKNQLINSVIENQDGIKNAKLKIVNKIPISDTTIIVNIDVNIEKSEKNKSNNIIEYETQIILFWVKRKDEWVLLVRNATKDY